MVSFIFFSEKKLTSLRAEMVVFPLVGDMLLQTIIWKTWLVFMLVTVLASEVIYAIQPAAAQEYEVLHRLFQYPNGFVPVGNLIQATYDSFYGTTLFSGEWKFYGKTPR